LVLAPVLHRLERVAFVENVVDQQHAAAAHRRGRTMQPGQSRAGGAAAVAGGVQVVELEVEAALAQREGQLPGERQAAVHHGEKQRRLRVVGIVGEDRVGDLLDGVLDLVAVEQQFGRVEDFGQLGYVHALCPSRAASCACTPL